MVLAAELIVLAQECMFTCQNAALSLYNPNSFFMHMYDTGV